ncbi:hypothetical protein Ddye_024916 [Dipteronia dyeriana]|uniref:Uncharacterized protein n=1 Tax=Dipteronia dyeriana TaxID=168575 RepID=A0AAD9TWC3_9ROSI|nr:hypothetical protein Ddye_024916 [Dipteronia dyeriana]
MFNFARNNRASSSTFVFTGNQQSSPSIASSSTFVFTGIQQSSPSTPSSSTFCHLNLFKEKQFPTDLEEHANDVVDFIPGITPIKVSDLPRFFLKNGQSVALDDWTLELPISKVQYVVCPSVYELESHVFDLLRSKFDFRMYPFGPLIPYFELNNNKPTSTPDYIEWLNSQPRSSVLYVAMGSIVSLSSDQTNEMAAGLRSSGVRYMWVGRGNTSRLKELCETTKLLYILRRHAHPNPAFIPIQELRVMAATNPPPTSTPLSKGSSSTTSKKRINPEKPGKTEKFFYSPIFLATEQNMEFQTTQIEEIDINKHEDLLIKYYHSKKSESGRQFSN